MSAKVQNINLETWDKIPCECGGTANAGPVPYKEYAVRGWTCKKCKRSYLHPEDSVRISHLEKLKKGKQVIIGKLGESVIIRIPKELAELYHMEKGETVTLIPESLDRLEVKI